MKKSESLLTNTMLVKARQLNEQSLAGPAGARAWHFAADLLPKERSFSLAVSLAQMLVAAGLLETVMAHGVPAFRITDAGIEATNRPLNVIEPVIHALQVQIPRPVEPPGAPDGLSAGDNLSVQLMFMPGFRGVDNSQPDCLLATFSVSPEHTVSRILAAIQVALNPKDVRTLTLQEEAQQRVAAKRQARADRKARTARAEAAADINLAFLEAINLPRSAEETLKVSAALTDLLSLYTELETIINRIEADLDTDAAAALAMLRAVETGDIDGEDDYQRGILEGLHRAERIIAQATGKLKS